MYLTTTTFVELKMIQEHLDGTDIVTTNSSSVNLIINDEVLWYIRLIGWTIFGQTVAILGVITNTINITIFIKLGMKDPMNISLLGLSVSDFFSCLTSIWVNLCYTPGFSELDLPFVPLGTHNLFAAWPHFIFVKITCSITACITIERCLCVTFALKVKEIVTTKRVTIVTVLIYITMVGFAMPAYEYQRFEWKFYPHRNKSLLTTAILKEGERLKKYQLLVLLYGVFLPIILLLTVIVFTAVLVHGLKKSSKWRSKAAGTSMVMSSAVNGKATSSSSSSSTSSSQISSRDAKVTRMVISISILFILCFSPLAVLSALIVIVPGFRLGGALANAVNGIFSFNFLVENINSSLNFFIYYFMSSNYKAMIDVTFRQGGRNEQSKR